MAQLDDLMPEKRRSFRLPVEDSLRRGILKVGGRAFHVQLFDESAEGFGATIKDATHFSIDDVGELETPTGRFEVRLAHVKQIACTRALDGSQSLTFRIGLTRLRDLEPVLDRPQGTRMLGWLCHPLRSLCPAGKSALLPGIGFAVLIIGLPLIVGGVLYGRFRGPLAAHAATMSQRFFGRGPAMREGAPAVAAPDLPTAAAGVQSSLDALRAEVLRAPGAEAFLLPDLAARLNLTKAQRTALGRLADTTREALREFERNWRSADPAEHATRRMLILDAARQEALQLLTVSQREQWKGLTTEPAPAAP